MHFVLRDIDSALVAQIASAAAHDRVVCVLQKLADGGIRVRVQGSPHDLDDARNIDFERNSLRERRQFGAL